MYIHYESDMLPDMLVELILLSFLIMCASLSGVLLLWKGFGRFFENNLTYFVSLSAGVILVVVYGLAQESLVLAGITDGLVWIGIGTFGMWLLFAFLPKFHHHHSTIEEKPHGRLDVRRILTSDAIHNIGDGIVLASALAVSSPFALLVAISIFVHEFVQEVSEFFVLREAGFSIKKALKVNFLISSTILIGAVGSFFLLETFEKIQAPFLGITAGAFLLVVLNDLIPHSLRSAEQKNTRLMHIVWFFIGASLMAGITLLSPHSHEHEASHEHEEMHTLEKHSDEDLH